MICPWNNRCLNPSPGHQEQVLFSRSHQDQFLKTQNKTLTRPQKDQHWWPTQKTLLAQVAKQEQVPQDQKSTRPRPLPAQIPKEEQVLQDQKKDKTSSPRQRPRPAAKTQIKTKTKPIPRTQNKPKISLLGPVPQDQFPEPKTIRTQNKTKTCPSRSVPQNL